VTTLQSLINARDTALSEVKTAMVQLQDAEPEATHQIGFRDQRGKENNKPTISGKRASATPIEFRDALLTLAKKKRQTG